MNPHRAGTPSRCPLRGGEPSSLYTDPYDAAAPAPPAGHGWIGDERGGRGL
jgi:hypothetical protein